MNKKTREKILRDLEDALETVEVGYPHYSVQLSIKKAIRLIKFLEAALVEEKP